MLFPSLLDHRKYSNNVYIHALTMYINSWTYDLSLPIPTKETNITLDGSVAKIIIIKHYIIVTVHYGTLKVSRSTTLFV